MVVTVSEKSGKNIKKFRSGELKNLLKARDFYRYNKAGTTFHFQCVLSVTYKTFLNKSKSDHLLIIICSNCHKQNQEKLVFGLGKVWEISKIFLQIFLLSGNPVLKYFLSVFDKCI